MRSKTLGLYASWLSSATAEQASFVDEVFALCELNYEAGGDQVVECFGPDDIVERFTSFDDVQRYVRLINGRAADCRWGDDSDPEINKPEWRHA